MRPAHIDREKCELCGACVEECGRGGVAIEEGQVRFHPPACMACGHCVAICPHGALTDAEGLPPEVNPALCPTPEGLEHFLRARRSHRRYARRPVERAVIERVIDVARYAPSGKNAQPFAFTVVDSEPQRRAFTDLCYARMEQARRKLANPAWRFVVGALFDKRVRDPAVRRSLERALRRREMGMDPLFFNAPVLFFVHGPRLGATPKDDCCYALCHAVLMAETLGLTSCLNGNSEVLIRHFPDLQDFLRIPRDRSVYAVATFGYPKRPFRRLVHRNPPQTDWL